jgi:Zn-dependent M28 family amino/carboxypeptidase
MALSKNNRKRLVFYPTLFGVLVSGAAYGTCMPGASYTGSLPAESDTERSYAVSLKQHVTMLGSTIGDRNLARPETLSRTVAYLETELALAGRPIERQSYEVEGVPCHNLVIEFPGAGALAQEVVLLGAHYDSARGAAGADDNGSGVAAVLVLAKAMRGKTYGRAVRFVLFANEEPPYFYTGNMGSLHYARFAKARGDKIIAMLSLETIGYYRDEPGTQKYPFPMSLLYPSRGNFIGFVGNVASRTLVRSSVKAFRESTKFPSEGAALPGFIPGVGWSDQWSFWQVGYPGLMVTDTAPFRNPNYHTVGDLPDTLEYGRFARVVSGLENVVAELAR